MLILSRTHQRSYLCCSVVSVYNVFYYHGNIANIPRWQSHRRSGLATLPSVGAVP